METTVGGQDIRLEQENEGEQDYIYIRTDDRTGQDTDGKKEKLCKGVGGGGVKKTRDICKTRRLA
jgi:hypothetical protein